MGNTKKHSKSEAIKTAITVNGISAIKLPNRPPTATKPAKAITVVMVAVKTGNAILVAPRSAASSGFSPSLLNLKSACSPTTIASSTTIPKQIINAKREIIFIVSPDIYIIPIAANRAAGIPAATQNAVLALRKTNKRIRTKVKPCRPLRNKISRRFEIASALVFDRTTSTPLGRELLNSSVIFSTFLWISIASSWANRSILTTIALFPLEKYSRFWEILSK